MTVTTKQHTIEVWLNECPVFTPRDVGCDYCGAKPGSVCHVLGTNRWAHRYHVPRKSRCEGYKTGYEDGFRRALVMVYEAVTHVNDPVML